MHLRLVEGHTTEDGWLTSKSRCLSCLRTQLNVYPVGASEHSLECAFCGSRRSALLLRVCPDLSVINIGQQDQN